MDEHVYAYRLHLMCGGYAYYSTYSQFDGFGDHHRDRRKPSLCRAQVMQDSLESFGQGYTTIADITDFDRWLFVRGWALVSQTVARELMCHFLNTRTCLKDSCGSFTDVKICSPHSTGRRPRVRDQVLQRDGGRCLLCGSIENPTLHHVTAYARGGETSSRNLVVLCAPCNQRVGTDQISRLYSLAGIPSGLDPTLLQNATGRDAVFRALELSANLMHSRCEVW